jgi:hypothetical protein
MTAIEFIAKLGPKAKAKRAGAGWMACCPAHQDSSPSLSIRDGRGGTLLLKCFAGCGFKAILAAAGVARFSLLRDPHQRKVKVAKPKPASTADGVEVSRGTFEQWLALARLRHLDGELAEPVRLAVMRGLVGFGHHFGHDCWLIGDKSGRNAQARRMDGRPFIQPDGSQIKSKTLPGYRASWPIGIPESDPYPVIMVVEGGPDLLAAHQFIIAENRTNDTAVVCITGAAMNPPPEAWAPLVGKRVRIYPHNDDPGRKAAARWHASLTAAGAVADAFNLDGLRTVEGLAINDLNDLARVDADQFEEDRELWNIIPKPL